MHFSVEKVTLFQSDVTSWLLFIPVYFALMCWIVQWSNVFTEKCHNATVGFCKVMHPALSLSFSLQCIWWYCHTNNDDRNVSGGGAGKQMLAYLSSRKVATSAWLLSPFQIKPARKCWTDALNARRAPFVAPALFEVYSETILYVPQQFFPLT